MAETPPTSTDTRYPTKRPGWLGPHQTWPCGRCGENVADESHPCPDNPKCGDPYDCRCHHGCDIP
jgi:hypothetical protein